MLRTLCLIFLFASHLSASLPSQADEVYKISVDDDGIYIITPDSLRKAGADPGMIDPRNFRATSEGREIPVYVRGSLDGRFGGGDYLEFYGQKHRRGEYTNTNVYWLSWDGKPGARMVEEDVSLKKTRQGEYIVPEQGFRRKVRFEIDNGRFQRYMYSGSPLWFWMRLNAPGVSQIPLDLEDVADSGEDGSVRVMLYGSVNKQHNMELFLNAGFKLGDISSSGQEAYLLENDSVPNYIFNSGNNIIGIYYPPGEIQGKTEQVMLDWVEIEYWRDYTASEDYLEFSNPQNQQYGLYQFEIEGFSNPDIELLKLSTEAISKLTDGYIEDKGGTYSLIFQDSVVQPTRYLALASDRLKTPLSIERDTPSQLRSASNGADYIIITHADFRDSAAMLSEFRASQGLRTVVVDVEDIYDEFSYGIFDPAAIRDFVSYAFHNWQRPAPEYVLLLGDSSWWYKRDKSYVPSYTYNSKVGDPGSEWGPTASDDYFVCVSGDDPIPDLLIGRIPAKTKEDARIAVEKIISYEKSPEPGQWRSSLLFLSGRQSDEPQFIFEERAEEFISRYVPSEYGVSRIYTNANSPYYGDTSDLLNAVDEGRSFIRFAGHGGGSIWSDDDLLSLEDIPLLRNGGRLPFIASWTCFTAWFDNPYTNCLAEDMLFLKGGGAIAFLGSTGLGLLYADLYLEEELYKVLFTKNERILGKAVAEAKASFLSRFSGRRDYVDLAATYTLIGDPATRLVLPAVDPQTISLPDLAIISSQISIPTRESGESFRLSIPVGNIGSAAADNVTMKLYDGDPFGSGSAEIYSYQIASIPAGGKAIVNLDWTPQDETSSAYVWVDPDNEIFEVSESNNIAKLDMRPIAAIVTPENGSSGPITSSDEIFTCDIPPGAVASQAYLTISQIDATKIPKTQPDIGVYGQTAYRIELSPDTADSNFTISFILMDADRGNLAVYRLSEGVERWIICDGSVVEEDHISAEVSQSGTYALLINNDATVPELSLTLKEQGFISDDFAPSRPEISIVAEDANGIKAVRILLDGMAALSEDMVTSGAAGSTPFSVEYRPLLRSGEHTVQVDASDANNLSASGFLTLTVESEFRIDDIANRPNPCSTKTLFTYVLTQPADDMTIKIYSASGRMIKKLDAPASSGYNELLWNLRDEDDRYLANGVYFYKLIARRDGKKVERIGKLAVLK